MECLEQCNGLVECVGLAHIGLQCFICQIESDTQSHQIIPAELRNRYLLDFDYLTTMLGALGRGKLNTKYNIIISNWLLQ